MQDNASKIDLSALSDDRLLAEAQNKNDAAMELIFSRFGHLALYPARRFFIPGVDEDDIVQEGLIGLYRAVIDFRPGRSSFRSFAILCISRQIISLIKASNRKKHMPLNSSVSLEKLGEEGASFAYISDHLLHKDPEAIVIDRENTLHYENETRRLLSDFEFSVWEYYLEDYSYKEISDMLGKDIKAIDNAIQRIRKKLMKMFEDQ